MHHAVSNSAPTIPIADAGFPRYGVRGFAQKTSLLGHFLCQTTFCTKSRFDAQLMDRLD